MTGGAHSSRVHILRLRSVDGTGVPGRLAWLACVTGWVGVLACAASALAAGRAPDVAAREHESAAATRPRSVLEGTPGWTRPNDPESLSVVTGRRHAPLVSLPFAGGAQSLDALGRAFVAAVVARDRAQLGALSITEPEFTTILWPEFPQSRPITGIEAAEAWFFADRRLEGGLARALAEYGGRPLSFVRVERGGVEPYRNFRLHRGLVVWVKNERGELESIDLLRSVAERKGLYKLYSMRD